MEKRNFKAIAFFVIIIVTLTVVVLLQGKASFFSPSSKPRIKTGAPAPNFTLRALDGRMVSLADYKGKVVFLNVWATWCPPCREEMPSMEKLYQELKGQGLEILAVSIDVSGAKAVAPFTKEKGLTFPALLDPEGTIQDLYGTTGVPESFIIDKKGIIEKTIIGPLDWSTPDVVGFFRDLMQRP